MQSADTNFTLRLRGGFQVDGRFYGDGGTAHDTFLLRRVRPIIEGTVFEKYDYRVMLDFGSGVTSSTASPGSFPKLKITGLPSVDVADLALYFKQYGYDGVPNLGEWKRSGWGPLGKANGKVTPGNPWDYTREDARNSGKDGDLTIEGVLETTGKTLYVVPKKGYPGI